MSEGTSVTHPYTCLSCSLAFTTATSQRDHYATDLHRYNSKRRVAGLLPLTAELFNEKVKASRPEAEDENATRLHCRACNKTFNTQATQATHELSKKHREAVFRAAAAVKVSDLMAKPADEDQQIAVATSSTSASAEAGPSSIQVDDKPEEKHEEPTAAPSTKFESSGDPKLDLLVAKRLLSAPPIVPTSCLFCSHSFDTPALNAAHMRAAHSFAIPEEEYLVDLEGLLRRLGEEVGTWNVCICCGKGYGGNINLDEEKEDGMSKEELRKKASRGVEAVRNHMQSKSHCRLRYDTEAQRLDLADFYDFRPSYPDYVARQERKAAKKAAKAAEGWEDVDGDAEMADDNDEGVEVVYEEASDDSSSEEDDDEDDDDALPASEITYGDSTYELVLPSGARLGHRAHRHIHRQNLLPYLDQTPFKPSAHSAPSSSFKPSPHSAALLSLVPAARKDKAYTRPLHEAGLIPAKGAGFGGKGEVVKAKNKGEAKEAGRSVREFRQMKAFADQTFVRGVRANSQKHFRDPLLQ